MPLAGAFLDVGDHKRLALHGGQDFLHLRFVAQFFFLAIFTDVFRLKGLSAAFQKRGDRPVFLRDERLDFALAVHDDADGDALHAAGGQASAHLFPQEGLSLYPTTRSRTRLACWASTRCISMARG